VLPDRFFNGDTANDTGGYAGDKHSHGFDPTDKGFFHGGDLKGLTAKLDYLKGMGITAIWTTSGSRCLERPYEPCGIDSI